MLPSGQDQGLPIKSSPLLTREQVCECWMTRRHGTTMSNLKVEQWVGFHMYLWGRNERGKAQSMKEMGKFRAVQSELITQRHKEHKG